MRSHSDLIIYEMHILSSYVRTASEEQKPGNFALAGIYFYNDDRSANPRGDTRPDDGRDNVRRLIHENTISWHRDFHVDGLRDDMTSYIRSVDGFGADIPEEWNLMGWINTVVAEGILTTAPV